MEGLVCSLGRHELIRAEQDGSCHMKGVERVQSVLGRFAFSNRHDIFNGLGPVRYLGKELLIKSDLGVVSVIESFWQQLETQECARHECPAWVSQYGQSTACTQLVPPDNRDQDSRIDTGYRH